MATLTPSEAAVKLHDELAGLYADFIVVGVGADSNGPILVVYLKRGIRARLQVPDAFEGYPVKVSKIGSPKPAGVE